MPFHHSAYLKSKTLYALDSKSYSVTRNDYMGAGTVTYTAAIDAIWTVSKKGAVQVCKGKLRGVLRHDEDQSLESFMDTFDTRYGGHPDARWDGAYMWAPETTLARMNELAVELDPILNALPQVPAGYDGWYKLGGK